MNETRKRSPDQERLCESEDGRIECTDHAPYRGSDTWMQRRYRRLTPEMASDLRQVLVDVVGRDEPLCEVCRGIARRASRSIQ